jgi:hypothetical protein
MIVGKPKLDQDGTFTMEKGWKMGMKSHEKWIKMVDLSSSLNVALYQAGYPIP